MYKNFVQVALPEYTEEEWAYAAALKNTYESAGLPGYAAKFDENIAKTVDKATDGGKRALNDFLMRCIIPPSRCRALPTWAT